MTRTIVAMLLMASAGACASSRGTDPVQPMAMRRDDKCAQYNQRPGTDRERTAQDAPEECWPALNEPTNTLTQTTYSPAPMPTGERTGQSMPASAVAQPVGKAPQ